VEVGLVRILSIERVPSGSVHHVVSGPARLGSRGWMSPRKDSTYGRVAEHRPCPRSLGRRLLLERRNRAPAGRRLQGTAPQLPETSPADDVARVRHLLARQSGPTVLAAHSYGGLVITSLSAPTHRTSSASSTSPASGSTRVSRSARCYSRVLRPRRWRMSMSTRRASPGSPRRFPRSLRRR
jgi:hypothetical protein